MRPEVLIIRCYRKDFGDVDIRDAPMPGDPIEAARDAAKNRLLSAFEDTRFRSGEQPHTASLIGEDGRIVSTFQLRPLITGGYAVFEVPNAPRT